LYNELYKAWKSEKSSEKTQPLASDFYQRVQTYLGGLEEDSASLEAHTLQGRLALKEKEVVTRLLQELKEARLQKLVNVTKHHGNVDATGLTEEETSLVKSIDDSLQAFEQVRNEPAGTTTATPEERIEMSVVRFLQDIPEIVGTDLKIYGPFKKEDVGSLPNQNAHVLVKQGAAKEIEVRNFHKITKKDDANRHQQ
jgi:DNA replication initiation complex subunit (GINS family)